MLYINNFGIWLLGQKDDASAKSRRDKLRQEDQLSHLYLDEPPQSPAASTSESLSVAKSEDNISAQTKKFLKFAGKTIVTLYRLHSLCCLNSFSRSTTFYL